MNDKPKLIIYEEQVFSVGQDTFIDATAENNNALYLKTILKQVIFMPSTETTINWIL